MDDKKNDKRSPHVETISPIPFRPTQQKRGNRHIIPGKRFVWTSFVVVLFILLTMAGYIFTSRQVLLQIDPPPEKISIRGGLVSPHFGDYYLLRPGTYTVQIEKTCFAPLKKQLIVSDEKKQTFNMTLHKLPGRLSVNTHPKSKPGDEIRDARIYIDGKEVGHSPLHELEVAPGNRQITIQSERYQEYSDLVSIEGCDKSQELDLALTPGWSNVTLSSVPSGAIVMVNGEEMGKTPIVLELTAGNHDVQLSADGYKTWQKRLIVKAESPLELENIPLAPTDGQLVIKTSPPRSTRDDWEAIYRSIPP